MPACLIAAYLDLSFLVCAANDYLGGGACLSVSALVQLLLRGLLSGFDTGVSVGVPGQILLVHRLVLILVGVWTLALQSGLLLLSGKDVGEPGVGGVFLVKALVESGVLTLVQLDWSRAVEQAGVALGSGHTYVCLVDSLASGEVAVVLRLWSGLTLPEVNLLCLGQPLLEAAHWSLVVVRLLWVLAVGGHEVVAELTWLVAAVGWVVADSLGANVCRVHKRALVAAACSLAPDLGVCNALARVALPVLTSRLTAWPVHAASPVVLMPH